MEPSPQMPGTQAKRLHHRGNEITEVPKIFYLPSAYHFLQLLFLVVRVLQFLRTQHIQKMYPS